MLVFFEQALTGLDFLPKFSFDFVNISPILIDNFVLHLFLNFYYLFSLLHFLKEPLVFGINIIISIAIVDEGLFWEMPRILEFA
jgi:hypothetical protein